MDPNEEHDLGTLLDGLSSPDPGVRDGWAYAELATGISTGRFAEHTDLIRTTAVRSSTCWPGAWSRPAARGSTRRTRG